MDAYSKHSEDMETGWCNGCVLPSFHAYSFFLFLDETENFVLLWFQDLKKKKKNHDDSASVYSYKKGEILSYRHLFEFS